MATIWCNGNWHDSGDGLASSSDRGLMHGLGLFETLLAVDGRPIHMECHLDRLQQGLKRLGWPMPEHDLKAAMCDLLKRNALQQGRARIRLAITAGSGPLNDLAVSESALCWITVTELASAPENLRLGLSPWRRNEHSPLTGLKCASYAENLMALDWARGQGWDEVIFLNTARDLCEAATANVFLVKGGVLLTPELESGCLPGVARAQLIELAKELKVEVRVGRLSLNDIEQADECFLSSATRGVTQVASFEDSDYHSAPISEQLAEAWEESLIPRR